MVKATRFGLAILAVIITGSSFTQTYDLAASIKRGKDVYVTNCQNCHSEDGSGQPGTYPPLANADYMKRPDTALITIILKGQSGPVTVNGAQYNDEMQALDYLTDDQIADVLNYAKNAWGNKSTVAILPAQVKQARQ